MNDFHPTDEQLSAALDGEDTAAHAHAQACDPCRHRLEGFEQAAAFVRSAPPGPRPEAREAAVRAALGAAATSPAGPQVVGLRRRRWALGIAAGVAAAVLAVAVAVPVLRDDSGPDEAALDAETKATGELPESSVGDLGDLADPVALGTRVRALLAAPSAAATSDAASAPSAGGSASGGSASGGSAAGGGSGAEAADQNRTAMAAGAPAPSCTDLTRAMYGAQLGALVLAGSLRWEGTPAVVLAYRLDAPAGEFHHRVFVMAQEDCRLLVVQTV